MKELTDKQYFELLEGLVLLWENGNTKDLSRAKNILWSIYRYAHVAHDRCGNKHEDWRREARDMYNSLKGSII